MFTLDHYWPLSLCGEDAIHNYRGACSQCNAEKGNMKPQDFTPSRARKNSLTSMKALSIQQPWAWAIFNVGKDRENRDWNTQYRGPVLIHCGLKVDKSAFDDIEHICGRRPPKDLPTGGIVGQVDIVGVSGRHDSKWFFGRYGFQLSNATPLPFMPCKGALSFFTPDYSSVYAKDKPKPVPAQSSMF